MLPPDTSTSRVALVLLWLVAAVVGIGAPAGAQPRLADEVTDEAGLFAGGEDELREALATFRPDVQLFVLTVETTGGVPVTRFADEVAAESSLGGNDALLVVAIGDRAYALWVADELTAVSDADVDAVSRELVEPRLAAGDFAGAAVAAAEGLVEAAADDAATGGGAVARPGERPDPAPPPPDVAPDGRRGPSPGALLFAVALIALAGMFVTDQLRERQGRKRAAEERDRRTGELARRANALLVASDEAIREATTELAFAEAEFGRDEVGPFAAALDAARSELHEAFAIRQRLDDTVPEPVDERQAMLEAIVAHAERVDELLTPEHERLDELRDLQRRAPELLAALPEQLDEAAARLAAAGPLLDRLVAASPTAAAALDGNLVEAQKHLAAARATVAATSPDPAEPTEQVRAVRTAQANLTAAGGLIDAVEHAAAELAEAEERIEVALVTAATSLDQAAAAVGGGSGAELARLAEGRALLDQARDRRGGDVLRAYELATKAEAAGNDALAAVREAEERRRRELAAADAALRTATAVHTRAADYIAARRRGVGREARTRLQESERHLVQARASRDDAPGEAVRHAEEAERLGDEAYRLAQADFDDYDRYQGPFGRGPFGGGYGGRRGGGVIMIGGFPIPLGGGGHGGGGFGGSSWGGGGFGGGRSVGGGFGGGGGRVSGGRF